MQVVISVILSYLNRVLGDFDTCIDTLVQNFFTSFLISAFVPLAHLQSG